MSINIMMSTNGSFEMGYDFRGIPSAEMSEYSVKGLAKEIGESHNYERDYHRG